MKLNQIWRRQKMTKGLIDVSEYWNSSDDLKFGYKEAIWDMITTQVHLCGLDFCYRDCKKKVHLYKFVTKDFVENALKYGLIDKPKLDVDVCIGQNNVILVYKSGEKVITSEIGNSNLFTLQSFFYKVIDDVVDNMSEEEVKTKLKNLHY